MKRILLCLMCLILLTQNIIVYADINANIDESAQSNNIPLNMIYPSCYEFEINGEKYFYSTNSNNGPLRYDKDEFDFFVKTDAISGFKCHDYLWTGEYYMARYHCDDDVPASWQTYKNFPVRLYDKNFNLINEHVFDKYVYKIDYYNGEYYCKHQDGWVNSSDFDAWSDCPAPPTEFTNNIVSCKDGMISFDNSNYFKVQYEQTAPEINHILGDYIFGSYSQNTYAVSLDNIYFLKLILPSSRGTEWVYFKDDNVFFEGKSSYYGYYNDYQRYYISINELDEELKKYIAAPYVIYNDKILAFEQPPVIQDDRTLIPIRFLFEQMGATVYWDGETRTAAISQNDRTITFSIGNTTATVNGQPTQMDVPARLISGKTMVPLRFLSENLGYTVGWDGENRIITVGS